MSPILETIAARAARLLPLRGDYVLYIGGRIVTSSRSLSEIVRKLLHLTGLVDGGRSISLITKEKEFILWSDGR